jgi:hypothetical protein
MSQSRRHRFPVVAAIVALLLLVAAYVLSYAPVVRFTGLSPGNSAVYDPVDWILEREPFRAPLLAWAGFWGVGDEFREPIWFQDLMDSPKARAIQDGSGAL